MLLPQRVGSNINKFTSLRVTNVLPTWGQPDFVAQSHHLACLAVGKRRLVEQEQQTNGYMAYRYLMSWLRAPLHAYLECSCL